MSSRRPTWRISDHFDGDRFFNPTLSEPHRLTLLNALRMLLEKGARWPSFSENHSVPSLHEKLGPDDIAVTFISHATFLIQMDGCNILTDPVWSKRASPVRWLGPARIRNPGVAFDDLPPIDLVLISHNHYDHMDLGTLRRLEMRFAPKVLVPLGDKKLVETTGMIDVEELDWWEECQINSKLKITFAPTQHFSSRSFWDRYKSLWGCYMIQYGNRHLYFSGDAGYSRHFTDVRNRLGSPDIALMSIGAYEPRWFMKPMHMNPVEAVQAHINLGAKRSIGMHYGTFHLSAEGVDQPKKDLKAARLEKGVPESDFVLLREGETRVYRASS